MRVLIDHSCLEIYLSSGEVLSTRVYRGQQPADSDAGIDFVAFGGTARVEVTVWPRTGVAAWQAFVNCWALLGSLLCICLSRTV